MSMIEKELDAEIKRLDGDILEAIEMEDNTLRIELEEERAELMALKTKWSKEQKEFRAVVHFEFPNGSKKSIRLATNKTYLAAYTRGQKFADLYIEGFGCYPEWSIEIETTLMDGRRLK